MPKPLESDHQRYQVQCCIADASVHWDPRCQFGATGRAEIRHVFAQPLVWFRPDDAGVKHPTCFAMPLDALHFSPADVAAMPVFYQRLLDPQHRDWSVSKLVGKKPDLIGSVGPAPVPQGKKGVARYAGTYVAPTEPFPV